MPRYFFDSKDGTVHRDNEGTDFPDHGAARKHAIVYAGEVMHHEPAVLWNGREFVVEVSAEDRTLLFTITAFATNAPAGGRTD